MGLGASRGVCFLTGRPPLPSLTGRVVNQCRTGLTGWLHHPKRATWWCGWLSYPTPDPGRTANMISTSEETSCRIDRRADYQGSRPPVDLQAGVEKSASGPSSSVAHQADEGEKASGRPPPPELPSPITTASAPGNPNATDHITTLEPYEHEEQQSEWTRVTRRNRNNRRKQRKIRQVLPLFERTSTEEIFDKYYIIRFPRLPIETKINIIATDRDLKNQIGNP